MVIILVDKKAGPQSRLFHYFQFRRLTIAYLFFNNFINSIAVCNY